mgnify:CR=1 FL=1
MYKISDIKMEEENIKLALAVIDQSIGNLKPEKIKQIQLDGLREAIGLLYEDKTIEDVCNVLFRYNLPVLRLPKNASEIID